MVHSSMFSKFIRFLLLVSLAFLSNVAFADPPYEICSSGSSYTNGSTFESNLNNLLLSLPSNASISKSCNASYGDDPDKVYSLYMCLDYISSESCQKCIATAGIDIVKVCPQAKEAAVFEEECQLRYSNRNFFGKLYVSQTYSVRNLNNISEPEKFKSALNEILYNITEVAAFNSSANMYATREGPFEDKTIYALVQCTRDLSAANCSTCLKSAIERDLPDCCSAAVGARILSPSCYLRYEVYPFYEGETGPADPSTSNQKGSSRKTWMIAGLMASAGLVIIIFCLCACCLAKNRTQKSIFSHLIGLKKFGRGQKVFDLQSFLGKKDRKSEEFSYINLSCIRLATENFSDSNKLGQGGFGPVYKGWHLWNEGKGLDLMDPLLADSCNHDEFLKYMHVGLLCVQEDAYDRPTMSSVVLMLKSVSETLPQPKKPPFSVGRFIDIGNNEPDREQYSVNGLTISIGVPR
ncbi:hypothetical protein L6164_035839 [Bauhinia variegata]|uniref:Uncharacterized protein n=1 Tax=Bauhinia variegata TaxID=167791 RepID=A0ACB9KF79_BAUVA|nr:hypothetical protein L6164_035839 [Bauhinia variegata]